MLCNKYYTLNTDIEYNIGKTSCVTTPVATWCALYNLKLYTVISSSIAATAEQFIACIKASIEDNPKIEAAFGNVINKKLKYNSEEIELDTKPMRTMIQSIPCTSSFRGRTYCGERISLLLCDDMQNENIIVTENACEALISRFNQDASMALQRNNNHVIALGTLQKTGDLYDYFRHSIAWMSREEKGILIDNLHEYFANHEYWMECKKIMTDKTNPNAILYAKEYYLQHIDDMQYPRIWDYFDCFDLAKEYFEDPVRIEREFQGNLTNVGERRIKTLITKSKDEFENNELNFVKSILSVDPAVGIKAKNDFSAFCVLSETDTGIRYARKCLIAKLQFEDYIAMIIKLLEDYENVTHISIERNTFQGSDVIKLKELIDKHITLRGRNLTIINKMRNKNKENRINSTIPEINSGSVIFNKEDEQAIEQIKEWAGTRYTTHDDMIDCLTDAIENISQIETVSKMRVMNLSFLGL
ncbi:MAG: hypothetical protein PHV07_00740 [Oscillospiraceae bacterium]|nr:hypothetical protein [Oscillospiraceae bacterium]